MESIKRRSEHFPHLQIGTDQEVFRVQVKSPQCSSLFLSVTYLITLLMCRLISAGTMEEKIYSRAVTKQAMSIRVVDKKQIDRHFNGSELADLYKLTMPNYSERPTPQPPSDPILMELLSKNSDKIFKYHLHESLLDNKEETELSQAEKDAVWSRYEAETKAKQMIHKVGKDINFYGSCWSFERIFWNLKNVDDFWKFSQKFARKFYQILKFPYFNSCIFSKNSDLLPGAAAKS